MRIQVVTIFPELFGPFLATSLVGKAIERGLTSTQLIGRFQIVPDGDIEWILDVAHNPDGAGVLARTLVAVAPPRPTAAVFAVLADKDWRGMLGPLHARVVDLETARVPPFRLPASRSVTVVDDGTTAADGSTPA